MPALAASVLFEGFPPRLSLHSGRDLGLRCVLSEKIDRTAQDAVNPVGGYQACMVSTKHAVNPVGEAGGVTYVRPR